jgi:hypothetical protein
MHRGIEGRTIFETPRDRRCFLDVLGEVHERYRFVVHAYCLLGSHYHAIIQTPDANLSAGMQWLGVTYSSWFNARRGRRGPLFQGRFRSVPVEDGAWAYELSLYVHLNPLRTAGFGLDRRRKQAEGRDLAPPPSKEQVTARLKELRTYPWSSYRAYAGYVQGPAWLHKEELLGRATIRKDEREKAYRRDARRLLHRGVDPSRLEQFREVAAIGGAEFIDRVKRIAGEGDRETERRTRLRARVTFEDVVCAVEHARGVDRSAWLGKHGDWGKWLVLRLARRYTGMTLAELGRHMGAMDEVGREMDYAAVSTGLRWFERKNNPRSVTHVETRACKILNI